MNRLTRALPVALGLLATSAPLSAGEPLKLVKHETKDTVAGGRVAMTLLVPAGWAAEETLAWTFADPDVPVRYAGRFAAKAGPDQVEFFPDAVATYSAGPAGQQGDLPPDGIVAALKLGVKLVRPGVRFTVTEEDATKPAVEKQDGYGQSVTQYSQSGFIRVRYELDGKPVEETFYGTLSGFHLTTVGVVRTDAGGWRLHNAVACRSAAADATRVRNVAQAMIGSARLTPEFFNDFVQVKATLLKGIQDRGREGWKVIDILNQTNKEISRTITDAYRAAQQSQDRRNEQFSDYVRGVEGYRSNGDVVKLPAGYDAAWVNDRGEYLMSDRAGYDPNRDLGGNWTELPKGR